METILSRDDKPPPSAAKTSDSVNNIIKKSYEDIINVNKQQTNSSVSITKESSEAGENDALKNVSDVLFLYTLHLSIIPLMTTFIHFNISGSINAVHYLNEIMFKSTATMFLY